MAKFHELELECAEVGSPVMLRVIEPTDKYDTGWYVFEQMAVDLDAYEWIDVSGDYVFFNGELSDTYMAQQLKAALK